MWLVKNATFAKKKKGKYILLPQRQGATGFRLNELLSKCLQWGWFIQTWQQTKKSQIRLLTHIHSILYPLQDVKGVLHIALEDVKPDIVTNCRVIGAVSRHGGSQEDDLCWDRINKYQSFWNGRDTLGLQCRFWASFFFVCFRERWQNSSRKDLNTLDTERVTGRVILFSAVAQVKALYIHNSEFMRHDKRCASTHVEHERVWYAALHAGQYILVSCHCLCVITVVARIQLARCLCGPVEARTAWGTSWKR